MSRRRIRSAEYRARRLKRHVERHVFIDEPLPEGGSCLTEYRRGVIVSVDIDPGTVALNLIESAVSA